MERFWAASVGTFSLVRGASLSSLAGALAYLRFAAFCRVKIIGVGSGLALISEGTDRCFVERVRGAVVPRRLHRGTARGLWR